MEITTLAGGCFWCTEAIFKNLKGVTKVVSGYSGGTKEGASYEDIHYKDTKHAESIQITFDPKEISYKELLYVFFKTHDPTTVDRQGADIGPEYRSMIFFADKAQQDAAHDALKEAQKLYDSLIVTEIVPFKSFYEAEDYHQDFYRKNPNSIYCQLVIDPKISKLKKDFKSYLKK